jgi:hypothetical protein
MSVDPKDPVLQLALSRYVNQRHPDPAAKEDSPDPFLTGEQAVLQWIADHLDEKQQDLFDEMILGDARAAATAELLAHATAAEALGVDSVATVTDAKKAGGLDVTPVKVIGGLE